MKKDGTSEEVFGSEARRLEAERREACVTSEETHRHRVHAEIAEAFATEKPEDLLVKLGTVTGSLLDWIQTTTEKLPAYAAVDPSFELPVPMVAGDLLQFVAGRVMHTRGRLVLMRIPGPETRGEFTDQAMQARADLVAIEQAIAELEARRDDMIFDDGGAFAGRCDKMLAYGEWIEHGSPLDSESVAKVYATIDAPVPKSPTFAETQFDADGREPT